MTELLEQLLKDRKQSIGKVKEKIAELEQFLTENNTREQFRVSFRVQGSLAMKPISSTVGKANNLRYIDFGWGKSEDGNWCLYYSDRVGDYFRNYPLSSADNDYQVWFVERMGIFLERMGEWLITSNELLDKGISELESVVCQ